MRPSQIMPGALTYFVAAFIGVEDLSLDTVTKLHICRVVKKHDGNLLRSSRELDIDTKTVRQKLRQIENYVAKHALDRMNEATPC